MQQTAIIGAGFIASAHIKAIAQRRDVRVTAVVDPSAGRAEALARGVGGAATFESVDALLAAQKPDSAHVLTPPPMHASAAFPLLQAGVDTLVEKPLGAAPEECCQLLEAARQSGAALWTNHNFTHHPDYLRAKALIESGRCGPLRRVQMRYAAPLRQMAARQFGHWMFNSPLNLLLEQVVHPLSQIDDLLGPIETITATPGPIRKPAEGIEIASDWTIDLVCRDGLAQLQVMLGASFPSWTLTALCDDGVVAVDIFEGRVTHSRSSNDIAHIDFVKRNLSAGVSGIGDGVRGLAGFVGELSRFGPAADGFSRSMARSIGAFYDALERGERCQDETGLRLVNACAQVSSSVCVDAPRVAKTPEANDRYDVAVLGGTGFIGQHLVRALVDRGARVAVMGRNTANLPGLFHHKNIGVFAGSISNREVVANVVGRARQTVNLAHGGGGADRDEIERNMVGGALTVARACAETNAERLIHVGSSAALYLGDGGETITMQTPPDPQADERADYARAKVYADKAMFNVEDVAVCIVRPAIVVGEAGAPFHSALGAYENETHCAGWNDGRNSLPFVLVEDVASAIIAALDAPLDEVTSKAFNLAGDVRWSARQYTQELASATGRPLKFHSSSVWRLYADEWLKWAVKKVAGRRGVARPSLRDLKSRGMVAVIDTAEEKRILRWRPCDDEGQFRARAIMPHVPKQP